MGEAVGDAAAVLGDAAVVNAAIPEERQAQEDEDRAAAPAALGVRASLTSISGNLLLTTSQMNNKQSEWKLDSNHHQERY
jgi:hypothetical protein